MSDNTRYLVNVKPDEAVLAVVGRASYLNCQCVSTFFAAMLSAEKLKTLKVDLSACEGMDSTFLGMLAGAALKIRSRKDTQMVLLNVSGRNLELVENLGLDRILDIENSEAKICGGQTCPQEVKAASHRQILDAHKNLVAANPENLGKFEDVINYLSREEKSRRADKTE